MKDIPLIATYYLKIFAAKSSKRIDSMSKQFLDLLQQHAWKGNIRELKNVIERATILSDGNELTVDDLPSDFRFAGNRSHGPLSAWDLASVEKLHIQRVLNHTKGNKTEAARLLNIGLTTLYRKIEEYHISAEA
jgi:DNA-binding NtrC family response regulator